jgi:hypothetical protein
VERAAGVAGQEEEWAGGLTGPGEFGGLAGEKEDGFGVFFFLLLFFQILLNIISNSF